MTSYGYYWHKDRDPWARAPAMMIELREMLALILRRQEAQMATIDQVLADVTDEGSRLDSLSTLLAGLEQQLKDALAGLIIPADVQTKIDAVFSQAETNKAKIDAALNSNVPPPVPGTP